METKPTHEKHNYTCKSMIYVARPASARHPSGFNRTTARKLRRCNAYCSTRNGKRSFRGNGDRLLGTSLHTAQLRPAPRGNFL